MTYTNYGARSWRALAAVLLAGLGVGTLQGCNDASGPQPVPDSAIRFLLVGRARNVSPDGKTVLLWNSASATNDALFFDVTTGVLSVQTQTGTGYGDFPTAVANGGRMSANYSDPVQAGVWSASTGWTGMGSFSSTVGCIGAGTGGAWNLSADGSVVVGMIWNDCTVQAFRWTDAGGYKPLDILGSSYPGSTSPANNRASVVSGDGTTAAGWAQTQDVDRWPAIWHANGTGFLLSPPAFLQGIGPAPGEINAISPDGSMVAGVWNNGAFYWTAATGGVDLGNIPNPYAQPWDITVANAIGDSNKLIVGASFGTAFVWTAAAGMRSLQSVAESHGIFIPKGYVLNNALSVSADGTVVLGEGTDPNGALVPFVLRAPVSIYGL